MKWLDAITDSMHMSLGELWEMVTQTDFVSAPRPLHPPGVAPAKAEATGLPVPAATQERTRLTFRAARCPCI